MEQCSKGNELNVLVQETEYKALELEWKYSGQVPAMGKP
jgi:hypothetical protein